MNAAARARGRRKTAAQPKPPPKAGFAVRFYAVTDFPELKPNETFAAPQSRTGPLLPDIEISPQTTFRRTELWSEPGYHRLDVVHERWKRGYHRPAITKNWRIEEKIRNSVIERFEFSAYLTVDRRSLYMRAPAQLADSALRVMQRERGIASQSRSIDVKAFLEAYRSPVQRAWFNNLRIMNVQSAALAGKDVDKSQDYRRYLGAGDISAVEVLVTFDNMPYWVTISRTNTIFFYLQDERRAITLAAHVNNLVTQLAEAKIGQITKESTNGTPEPIGPLFSPDMSPGYDVSETSADS